MTKKFKLQKQNVTMSEALRGCEDLSGLYKNASVYKWRAWTNCKKICEDYGGHDLKAKNGNCNFFTAGFVFENENNESIFCKITHKNLYFYKII